tara:strand:- start:1807 stop:2442 length:636 start_codon:yes stop_codon:yes gene_type:complete
VKSVNAVGLPEVLPNVRKAFRIVAAYQKRTLQQVDYICRLFPEMEFDFWTPEHWSSTGRKILPSQGKWEVDGLPFYSFSVLLVDPNLKFAVEILHCSDTGLDDIENFQHFDPWEMRDAENTSTTLSLIGWLMSGVKNRAEWRSAYYDCQWPEDDGCLSPTARDGIFNIRYQSDVADLNDRNAIDSFVCSFRRNLLMNGFDLGDPESISEVK